MPIVREFSYEYTEEQDFKGFRPLWFLNATPTTGFGCAHDVLEHFKTQASPLAGECEAVGAMLALRMEYAGLSKVSESVSSNVVAMLEDYLRGDLELPNSLRTKPLACRRRDADIVDGVSSALSAITQEVPDEPGFAEKVARLGQPEVALAFISWIRRGYRRAVKRYWSIDRYTVGFDIYQTLASRLDGLMNSEWLWDFARVRVCVSLPRESVTIHVYVDNEKRWVNVDLFG